MSHCTLPPLSPKPCGTEEKTLMSTPETCFLDKPRRDFLSPQAGFNIPDPKQFTSLDEDLANDPRLSAIFSQGMIIVDSRLETESSQQHEPIVLLNNVLTETTNYREKFDNPSVQRKLFAETAKKRDQFTYAGYSFDHSKRESLLDYLRTTLKDTPSYRVKVSNQPVFVPDIPKKEREKILSALLTYQQVLFDNIEATLLGPTSIDRESTLQVMKEVADPSFSKLTIPPDKKRFVTEFIIAKILESIAFEQQTKFLSFIKMEKLTLEHVNQGIFLHHDLGKTKRYPPDTLVSDIILGTSVNTVYNLNFQQVQDLIVLCFSKDVSKRLKSKYNLLSSVNNDIRNEIALHPTKVLERSFLETYLDREEVLNLMFSTQESKFHPINMKCPHCNCFVSYINFSLTHNINCPVIKWLHHTFGYDLSDGTLSIPKLVYLQPPIARYAQALLKADAEQKLKPFIATTNNSLKIMTIDGHGRAHMLSQQGPLQVEVVKPP